MSLARAASIALLLLAGAALGRGALAAPTPCAINITLTPSERDAPVTSTEQAAVTFTGNYTADFPSFERGQVTLTAVVDQNWVATVSPASITVTQTRTGSFSATVVVPAGTFPSPVGTLTVTVRMIVGGISCQDQETGLVKPLPYFDAFNVRVDPKAVELGGGAASMKVTLSANASVPVTAALAIGGPDGVSFRGPTTVVLPAPGTGASNTTVTIQISAPSLAPGTYQITVRVRGTTQDGLTHEVEIPVPLKVPEGVGAALSSPFVLAGAASAVAAGAAVFLWRRRLGP